jgi:hypothetical protein
LSRDRLVERLRSSASCCNPDVRFVSNELPLSTHGVITQGHFERGQALTVWRMTLKALVPVLRRAVSTTVRISASPAAAHMAR